MVGIREIRITDFSCSEFFIIIFVIIIFFIVFKQATKFSLYNFILLKFLFKFIHNTHTHTHTQNE